MEGDSAGYSSNVMEQSGREPDYLLSIDGVVCIPCLNWVFQVLGGEFVFSDKSPVMQEILAPLFMRARVSTAFIMCKGVIS